MKRDKRMRMVEAAQPVVVGIVLGVLSLGVWRHAEHRFHECYWKIPRSESAIVFKFDDWMVPKKNGKADPVWMLEAIEKNMPENKRLARDYGFKFFFATAFVSKDYKKVRGTFTSPDGRFRLTGSRLPKKDVLMRRMK